MHFDFNNMMSDVIGTEHGITEQDLKSLESLSVKHVKELKEERAGGSLPFLDLPYDKGMVADILETAAASKGKFKNLVVVGIGGSALGNIAIHTALNHPFHNVLDDKSRNNFPRVFVLDNVDPERFSGLMTILKPEETLYNFITKSGTTVETLSQFLIITKQLREKLGKGYKEHVITTTDADKGTLRSITSREGFKSFVIPSGIGGRYSVLTPVGLFSAAMSGVDIVRLLEGASSMDKTCQSPDIWKNPALMSAALYFLNYARKNKNILIMMPYASQLSGAADWFCQLWAESLGKRISLNQKVVNTGSTPVRAVGVVDQHSQLQLYMEGPYDKVITFWTIKQFKDTVMVPDASDVSSDIRYLNGHSLNNIMCAEFEGTRLALTEQKRPNCTLLLDDISAFSLGQLFYFYELQTAYAGKFFNVNTFDQPGVEAGKINALAMLGKSDYAERKNEISVKLQGAVKRYII